MTTAGSLPVPNTWVNDRFGSKKGLYRHIFYQTKSMIGGFYPIKVKKGVRPARLVFVCMGNICRSPLAEAVAKYEGYNAISYGLNTRGGDTADSRVINYAQNFGIDLTRHRTRRMDEYVPKNGDLVIGMEPRQLKIVKELHPNSNVTLLGLYSAKSIPYIHDPYNTNDVYFEMCEKYILRTVKALIKYVS